MAIKNITAHFENNLRRFADGSTATVPAQIKPADVRSGTPAETVISADEYRSGSIPAGVVVLKYYLIIEEAFDTGALSTVTVTDLNDVAIFTAVDVLTVGATVSANVDDYHAAANGYKVTFSGNSAAGVGRLKLVAQYVNIDATDGRFTT